MTDEYENIRRPRGLTEISPKWVTRLVLCLSIAVVAGVVIVGGLT